VSGRRGHDGVYGNARRRLLRRILRGGGCGHVRCRGGGSGMRSQPCDGHRSRDRKCRDGDDRNLGGHGGRARHARRGRRELVVVGRRSRRRRTMPLRPARPRHEASHSRCTESRELLRALPRDSRSVGQVRRDLVSDPRGRRGSIAREALSQNEACSPRRDYEEECHPETNVGLTRLDARQEQRRVKHGLVKAIRWDRSRCGLRHAMSRQRRRPTHGSGCAPFGRHARRNRRRIEVGRTRDPQVDRQIATGLSSGHRRPRGA